MNDIYYKFTLGNMKSFSEVTFPDADWIITYRLNEWIAPRLENSKLFVFKDLDLILKFMRKQSRLLYAFCLFECEVKNPSPMILCNFYPNMILFWKNIDYILSNPACMENYNRPPVGTIGVDEVYLTKEILDWRKL